MKKTIILFAAFLLLLLSACGGDPRDKEARKLAEDYLEELKTAAPEDMLSLSEEAAERFGDMYAFIGYSELFGTDFRININSDNSVTDTYFAASLNNIAYREFFNFAFPLFSGTAPDLHLTVNKNIVSSALSKKTFDSIEEVYEIAGEIELVQATLYPMDDSAIKEDELFALLQKMQEEKFYGTLTVNGDTRVFHISGDEINYTKTDDPSGEVRFYPIGE